VSAGGELLEKPTELGDRTLDEMRQMATDAGLEVIDLRGAYAGVRSRKSLWTLSLAAAPATRNRPRLPHQEQFRK
jgi:hypothetical protein